MNARSSFKFIPLSLKDPNLAGGGMMKNQLLKENFKKIDAGGYKHGAKEKDNAPRTNYQISKNQSLSKTPNYFELSIAPSDLSARQSDENGHGTGVKNLLDKKYDLSASNYRIDGTIGQKYMPAAARNYYVEFKYAY